MDIPQPFVVNQYNKFMMGVDRFDQNNNHLRISVGGKMWYWPVVTWLVDSGIHNAWQLHRKSGGLLTLLMFKRDLVCNILRGAGATRSRNSSGSSGPFGARPGDGDLRYDGILHFVKKREVRRFCSMEDCKSKVVTYCGKCNRAVCIDHFEEYHSRS